MLLLAFRSIHVTNEPKTKQELMTTWEDLLEQAASRCDVDPDSFVRGAWAAYLEARPGMKEHLEELHLRAQLEELRKEGRIGLA
jgi:hypothetical protein